MAKDVKSLLVNKYDKIVVPKWLNLSKNMKKSLRN